MPVSLLTSIAAGLHVSQGLAGRGIAISSAFAGVASLWFSALAGSMNRKTLLLALTGVMALSGAVIATTPNYLIHMAGRALIGMVVGGFRFMSAFTVLRLVPADEVPRALTSFNGGSALATVVAAPLSSYLGSVIGWRGLLLPGTGGLIALAWQWFGLPSMRVERRKDSSSSKRFYVIPGSGHNLRHARC